MGLAFVSFGKWSIEWKMHCTPRESYQNNDQYHRMIGFSTLNECECTLYIKNLNYGLRRVNFLLCILRDYHHAVYWNLWRKLARAHHDSRMYAKHIRLENITAQHSKCKWLFIENAQKKRDWWFHLLSSKTPTNLFGVAQLFYQWLRQSQPNGQNVNTKGKMNGSVIFAFTWRLRITFDSI